MTRTPASPSAVYGAAAIACLVGPALGWTTMDPIVVWSFVLLAGVPVTVMAILLALIHAQHGLVDHAYRTTAALWAATALLVLTPVDAWVPVRTAVIVHWARVTATALVPLLFLRLTVHIWKLPGKERIVLALGFGSVAIFFGALALRYVLASNSAGLEAVSADLAEFFVDAVVTCLLLLSALAAGRLMRRRVCRTRVA